MLFFKELYTENTQFKKNSRNLKKIIKVFKTKMGVTDLFNPRLTCQRAWYEKVSDARMTLIAHRLLVPSTGLIIFIALKLDHLHKSTSITLIRECMHGYQDTFETH